MKRNIALAALAVAVGTVLIISQAAWSDRHHEAYKVEGAWIAKVVGMPMQWTYTMSHDPSGRKAAMYGTVQVAIRPAVVKPGLFPDAEYISDFVGEMVMTGHDTMKFTVVWYGLKKAALDSPFSDNVEFIGVNSGTGKFTGLGQSEVTHHLAFYDPASDADGDGLPDPGKEPKLCLPATISLDTRVPFLQPCTP